MGRYEEICRMPARELEALLRAGRPPRAEDLAGREFRGTNTPWFTNLLGIKKFIKGFFNGPDGLEGYNIPVKQNGVSAPWVHKPSDQAPSRFGFYTSGTATERYPGTMMLDYGASARNAWWQPERLLRDYMVVVPGTNIVLGKAYLAFGSVYVHVSYFILEELRRTSWKPDATA